MIQARSDMRLEIETIPHSKQRYETCGDYYHSKGKAVFKISKTKPDYEFLITIHELIEWYLTQKRGISIKDIDEFDKRYKGNGEPGDSPHSPYHKEHKYATWIERLLARELGVDWNQYEADIDALSQAAPGKTPHNKR